MSTLNVGKLEGVAETLGQVSIPTGHTLGVEGVLSLGANTGAFQLPAGGTSQRPQSPSVGYLRWNTDTVSCECWSGTDWVVPFVAGGGGAATIVTNGLDIHLDAGDSNSYSGSGNTWTNIAPAGTPFGNATIYNPNWTSNNNGYFQMSGNSNELAQIETSSVSYNTFTYNIWIRPTNLSGWRSWVDQDNDDWLFATSGVDVYCYDPTLNTGYDLVTNTWYNLTMTHTDGGPVRLYVNGVLEYASGNQSTQHTTTTWCFGAGDSGTGSGNEPFIGDYAVAMVYNRELSSSEVQINYDAMCERYGLTPIGGSGSGGGQIQTAGLASWLDPTEYTAGAATWTDKVTGAAWTVSDNTNTYKPNNYRVRSSWANGTASVSFADGNVTAMNVGTNPFTMEGWFWLPYSPGQGWSILMCKSNFWSSSDAGLIFNGDGSQLQMFSDGGNLFGYNSSNIGTGWKHIVAMQTQTGREIYINGAVVATSNTTHNFNNTFNLSVGANQAQQNILQNAGYGHIRYYSTYLSAAQIAQHFNAEKSFYGL